jgi:hypothetical protein
VSFQDFESILNSLSGTGAAAAVEDEVKTNRFTVGDEAADLRMLWIPDMTSGITALGSGLNDRFEATCAMPDTPTRGK